MAKNKLFKTLILIFSLIIFISLCNVALAINDLLSLEMRITENNLKCQLCNISITIWNHSTWTDAESLMFNGSYEKLTEYRGAVVEGYAHLMIGNDSMGLNLTHGQPYYLDIDVNGADMDFEQGERQIFQASIGDINESIDGMNISGEVIVDDNITVVGGISSINAIFDQLDVGTFSVNGLDVDMAGNLTNTRNISSNYAIFDYLDVGSFSLDGLDISMTGNITNTGNISSNYAIFNTLEVGTSIYSNDDNSLYIAKKIIHIGDTDTWLEFATNQISMYTGNIMFLRLDDTATQDEVILGHDSSDVDVIMHTNDIDRAFLLDDGGNQLNISVPININQSNITSDGNISAEYIISDFMDVNNITSGNITSNYAIFDFLDVGVFSLDGIDITGMVGNITTSGNISADYLIANQIDVRSIVIGGVDLDIGAGNITTTGNISSNYAIFDFLEADILNDDLNVSDNDLYDIRRMHGRDNMIIFTTPDYLASDFDIINQTDMTTFWFSNSDPDSNNEAWGSISHDNATMLLDAGMDNITAKRNFNVRGDLAVGDERQANQMYQIGWNGTTQIFEGANTSFFSNVSFDENIIEQVTFADNVTIIGNLSVSDRLDVSTIVLDGTDFDLGTGNLTTTGNLSGEYIISDFMEANNVTFENITATNIIAGNIDIQSINLDGTDLDGVSNISMTGNLSILGGEDHMVEGNLTMDDNISANYLILAAGAYLGDDQNISLGAADDAAIEFDTAQTNDALIIGVDTNSRTLLITEALDIGTDLARVVEINPTIGLYSSNADSNEWIGFTHDTQKGIIDVGGSAIGVAANTANVTEVASQLHLNQNVTVGADLIVGDELSEDELFYIQSNGTEVVFVSEPTFTTPLPFWFETSAITFFSNVTIDDTLTIGTNDLGVNITTNTTFEDIVKLEPIGAVDVPCDAEMEGTLFYNATRKEFCFCDGTNFVLWTSNSTTC